ncbi:MAG: phosphotransferase [Chloroflexi bacterium]|nr:phosphotransferase [Chloroflexota bacterium]
MTEHAARPMALGRTAEIFDIGNGRVLKLFRSGWGRASAERELSIARELEEAGVPAPRALGMEQQDGRYGVVFEKIVGPSMWEVLASKPWRFAAKARQLASLHVGLHSKPIPGLPSCLDDLRSEIEHAPKLSGDLRSAALKLLDQMPTGRALCHGDLHPGNVILTSQGPRVIDWADATSGHPLADVARTIVLLRFGPLQERIRWKRALVLTLAGLFLNRYVAHYARLAGADRDRLRRWEIISAAARLNTDIPAEHDALLKFVRRGLGQQHT